MKRRSLHTFLLIAIASVVSGCLVVFALGFVFGDPGYTYVPIDARGGPINRWSQTTDGVILEGGAYETLIGERSAMYEANMINKSMHTTIILGGTLTTKGNTLKAYVPKGLRRTVPPGSSGEIVLYCDYNDRGRDASDVLGQSLIWTWQLQIGDQEKTVKVKMIRQ